MAFFPISHTTPQYVDTNGDPFSGAVLKAFESGTTNNINMATDSTGDTTAATITLNADGYPAVSGTIIIPYIDEKYKLALFPTQAAADSNTGAIWTVDTVPISGDFGSVTQSITSTTALDSSDAFNHLEASGTITINLPDVDVVGSGFVFTIRNAGTGTVTLDADGAETINGFATVNLLPGEGALVQSGLGNFSAIISRGTNPAVVTVTSTSNATTINLAIGDVFTHTFTEDTTFTFSNPEVTGINTGFKLFLTNDGTGRTPTWPGTVIWPGGDEPILTTINEKNVLVFETIDGGTIWYGALAIGAAS